MKQCQRSGTVRRNIVLSWQPNMYMCREAKIIIGCAYSVFKVTVLMYFFREFPKLSLGYLRIFLKWIVNMILGNFTRVKCSLVDNRLKHQQKSEKTLPGIRCWGPVHVGGIHDCYYRHNLPDDYGYIHIYGTYSHGIYCLGSAVKWYPPPPARTAGVSAC